MDVTLKQRGGHNVVLRPEARRRWYPEATVEVSTFELWAGYADRPASEAWLVGRFRPGQQARIPWTPATDRNLRFYLVSVSASGTRDVITLEDAVQATLPIVRETETPEVSQVSASTHTQITLAIDNYSIAAIKRKVRTADNSLMTSNLSEQVTEVPLGQQLPRLHDLLRGDSGAGARTVYVRISHSSGGNYGPESAALAFTFADSGGTGGTSGDTDPFPRREYTIS
jgi:hypothetical protein